MATLRNLATGEWDWTTSSRLVFRVSACTSACPAVSSAPVLSFIASKYSLGQAPVSETEQPGHHDDEESMRETHRQVECRTYYEREQAQLRTLRDRVTAAFDSGEHSSWRDLLEDRPVGMTPTEPEQYGLPEANTADTHLAIERTDPVLAGTGP